jgi:hypothetical protein
MDLVIALPGIHEIDILILIGVHERQFFADRREDNVRPLEAREFVSEALSGLLKVFAHHECSHGEVVLINIFSISMSPRRKSLVKRDVKSKKLHC